MLPAGYTLVEGIENTDFEAVHAMLTDAYWCKGISKVLVRAAAEGSSIVINVFYENRQVAYARVVSDRATFGWICDVIVHEGHRGKGLGRAMTRFALQHPLHQGFRRWVLATRDAHGVYAGVGFEPVDKPENWMVFRPADAPQRNASGDDVV